MYTYIIAQSKLSVPITRINQLMIFSKVIHAYSKKNTQQYSLWAKYMTYNLMTATQCTLYGTLYIKKAAGLISVQRARYISVAFTQ